MSDAFSWISDYLHCSELPLADAEVIKDIVHRAIKERAPDANTAIVFGSTLKGIVNRFSDVDVLCIVGGPDRIDKQQFVLEGLLFELVTISVSLVPRLADLSRRNGRSVGLYAFAYGEVWFGQIPHFETVQAKARLAVLALEAVPADAVQNAKREMLSDLMAMSKTADDKVRTVFGISLINKLTQHLVQNDIGKRHFNRSAIRHFSSEQATQLLRSLMQNVLNAEWDQFSLSLKARIFADPMTWERKSKVV